MSEIKKRRSNPYVTHAECASVSGGLQKDMAIVKRALVGEDLQSGIVANVAELRRTVVGIMKQYELDREQRKEKRETLTKWKISLVSLIFTIIGFIASQLINKLW